MKATFLTLLAATPLAVAQLPKLDELQIQGAAALALANDAPTEIAHPTGARELGLTLLGGASGADFAFETKPYWWSNHVIDIGYYRDQAWGWDAIQQSFSISASRYEFENDAGDNASGLSLGLAFDFLRGPASSRFWNALEKTKIDFPNHIDPNNPQGSINGLLTKEGQAAVNDAVADLVKGRVGWNASFASAASFEFEDTDYHGGEFSKFGGWLVTSYTPDTEGDQVSFISLARVLNDQGPGKDDLYFDVGARLLWSLEKVPLSLSAEYIRRFADNSDDSDRLAALLEYRVNKTFSIFASHGLNFDQNSGKDEVFTSAGLTFGIGRN